MTFHLKSPRRGSVAVRAAFPVLFAVLVAGCGGGGSASSSTSSTPTSSAPTTETAITQQNSPQAAGAGYQSVSSAEGAGSTGGSTVAGVTGAGSALPNLLVFARQQIEKMRSIVSNGGNAVSGATMNTTTVTCDSPPGGGAAGSLSMSMPGSGTLAAGDTVSASFSNCYMASDGYTTNGSFSLALSSLSGSPPTAPWSMGGAFSFSNLSIAGTGINETVNGGFSFSESTSDGITINMALNGASVEVEESGGPSLWLQNFQLTATADTSTGESTFYGSGQSADSALNGYVDCNIPSSTAFMLYAGQQYPSSGSMTVTGANNTSVTLTAISDTTVELQVTINGQAGSPFQEPWSSISP